MNRQNVTLTLITVSWTGLAGLVGRLITGEGLTFTWGVFSTLVLLSPLAIRGIAPLLWWANPQIWTVRHRRGQIQLHLSPWLYTGNLNRRQIRHIWSALKDTLAVVLEQQPGEIVMSSHLLSPVRLAHLQALVPSTRYLTQIRCTTFAPQARTLLQLDILIREWRWFHPSYQLTTWVIKRKHST